MTIVQLNSSSEAMTNSMVLLENGYKEPLRTTYLPLPKLKRIACELCVKEEFPFIAMSHSLRDEEKSEWTFVENLSVDTEPNLNFFIDALVNLQYIHPTLDTTMSRDPLMRIYQTIQSKCTENIDYVR